MEMWRGAKLVGQRSGGKAKFWFPNRRTALFLRVGHEQVGLIITKILPHASVFDSRLGCPPVCESRFEATEASTEGPESESESPKETKPGLSR